MTDPRPFYLAAVLFAAMGAALRLVPVWPAGAAESAPLPVPAAAAAVPRRVAPDTARDAAIVASNPFSPDRKAPARRFVPEGLRRDTVPVARERKAPRETPPRLFGITRGPGGAVALIDGDPAVPGAEVYEVGDPVRDGRVTAIGDSTVTLSRPSGPLVLRLPDAGERR
jgi:hypothetical protein